MDYDNDIYTSWKPIEYVWTKVNGHLIDEPTCDHLVIKITKSKNNKNKKNSTSIQQHKHTHGQIAIVVISRR